MNVHHAERIAGQPDEVGYAPVADGAQPDVVVFNTCTVRGNADQNKLAGNLGHLKPVRDRTPGMQIAVSAAGAGGPGDDPFRDAVRRLTGVRGHRRKGFLIRTEPPTRRPVGFVPRGRLRGLHLIGTDLDRSWGNGVEVRGRGIDLLMAACGRAAVLTRLDGPGGQALADRLDAAAS